jgi:hypothetical protein
MIVNNYMYSNFNKRSNHLSALIIEHKYTTTYAVYK